MNAYEDVFVRSCRRSTRFLPRENRDRFRRCHWAAAGGRGIRSEAFRAGSLGAHAEALALYRQSVLRAAQDVEDTQVTLSQTRDREVQAQVQALTRARDLAQQSYKAGSIPLTDVLNADTQMLTARDILDAERGGSARAAVAVFRSFGGGWTPPAHEVNAASTKADRQPS